jgi:hypothetical protein
MAQESWRPVLPERLVDEVTAGNCVAFVGAGFSACALPDWRELLLRLAREVAPRDVAERVERIVQAGHTRPFEREVAAQLIRDAAEPERFMQALRGLIGRPLETLEPAQRRGAEDRLRWLRGVPFAAVVTTNYDELLPGILPGPRAYRELLRPQRARWHEERYWRADGDAGPTVLKLHGDVAHGQAESLVFCRRDYRERLYRDPGYLHFLRALFARHTVLYLGFSFTDAYFGELRSELLALIGHDPGDRPVAYAVMNDIDDDAARFYRDHEGMELLTYDSRGNSDFSGFDAWLEALHAQTSPARILGALIAGRRVLWLDPQPRNNDYGTSFLDEAAREGGGEPCVFDRVTTWEEAVATLERTPGGHDLVVTHWGEGAASDRHGGGRCSNAERLLEEMRGRDLRAPVIVFSETNGAERRKRAVTRLGARAFVWTWSGLFEEIERLFAPVDRSG